MAATPRRSRRLTRTRETLSEVKERLVREHQVRTDKKLAQLGLQFEVVRERRPFYGLSRCGVFVSVLLGVSLVISVSMGVRKIRLKVVLT
jgi:hypothetical protein